MPPTHKARSGVDSSSSPPLTIDDVYAQMDRDGKALPSVSNGIFLATAFLGVPLWLTTVMPLTVTYQLGRTILKPFIPNKVENQSLPPTAAVIPPPLSDITPKSDRKYDVVLLGTTGFTGKLAATYMAKTYGVGNDVKWAIAGRNQSKLDQVKRDIAKEVGQEDVMKVDTLIVDTFDLSTLPTLVKDSRTVITTVGPFEQYGSNVVEFCAKYGTNYVDITGEIEWMKSMMLKWDETAQRTGSKMVSLCGFDSVPWDLTVHKLSQILREECQEELVNATCLDEVMGSASGGTIATFLYTLEGKAAGAPQYDFNPLLKLPNGKKSPFRTKDNNPFLIEKCNRQGRFASRWTTPFIMAGGNTAVVKRSNAIRANGSTSLTYREARVEPDFKTAFVNMFLLGAGLTALMNPITRLPFKRYVLPKPGEGPSKEKMRKGFLCVSGEGVGSKGGRAETVMYFPVDAGYQDTARMVVESGLCLALDEDKLPIKQGGFWTCSTAMGDILLDRICATGTYFASRIIPSTGSENRLKGKM